MPTGNIAGDLQPRLFFSPPSHHREAVRGYPFLPPLSRTTRKHSLVATTDRTIPGKQVWRCYHRTRNSDTEIIPITDLSAPKIQSYYLLTPRSRVLLEKLTGLQLVKKFPALHGTPRFITVFTSARHLSLS